MNATSSRRRGAIGAAITATSLTAAASLAAGSLAAGHADGPGAPILVDRIGPPEGLYVDPEILPGADLMIFQSGDEAWLAHLDPVTGNLRSRDGFDIFVADGLSPLVDAKNGPEFAVDASGWTVFYNRTIDDVVEVWRATPRNTGATRFRYEARTDATYQRVNQLPSQDSTAPSTWVMYARDAVETQAPQGEGGRAGGQTPPEIVWFDDADPSVEHVITPITPQTAGFRWVADSSIWMSTIGVGEDAGQIVMGDASTGDRRVITDDPGVKFDPDGWFAPEFGGELLVYGIVEQSKVAVYRDLGGPRWERIATLDLPESTTMEYLQSPEPVAVGGRSYIISTLKDHPGGIFGPVTESEIWLYGLPRGDEPPLQLRCDDGLPGHIRHEGESYIGQDELIIYYNQLDPTGISLWRVRTGIAVDPLSD